MAHALVAHYERLINDLLRDVLEDEGHAVTAVTSCWDMLMVMRASLHPFVVVCYDLMLMGPSTEAEREQNDQERVWEACTRYVDDLGRHRFIETSARWGLIPEEMRPLREQLGIVRIRMPFTVDDFLARFDEAVDQLKPGLPS